MNNGFRTWICLRQKFFVLLLTHYRLSSRHYRKIAEQNVRHYFSSFILWRSSIHLISYYFRLVLYLIPCRTHAHTCMKSLRDVCMSWRITWCIMTWQKQFIIDLNYWTIFLYTRYVIHTRSVSSSVSYCYQITKLTLGKQCGGNSFRW